MIHGPGRRGREVSRPLQRRHPQLKLAVIQLPARRVDQRSGGGHCDGIMIHIHAQILLRTRQWNGNHSLICACAAGVIMWRACPTIAAARGFDLCSCSGVMVGIMICRVAKSEHGNKLMQADSAMRPLAKFGTAPAWAPVASRPSSAPACRQGTQPTCQGAPCT
jgi:hypothetical protein